MCHPKSGLYHRNPSFPDDAADKTSQDCLAALESIDDDLDEKNILAVKMADTVEARNYGVKKFPSVIVFVKKIPELYEGVRFIPWGSAIALIFSFSGDVTDEAAVLGWALTQAGVKIAQKKEIPEDILAFPAADAGKSAPPTPKVTPKETAPKPPTAVEEEEGEEVLAKSAKPAEKEEEEPELSETVDKIKNDNNVVVFFCKYNTLSQIDVSKISPSFTFLCFTLKQCALIFVLNQFASLLTRNRP